MERIEGEYHYAREEHNGYDWGLYRSADDQWVKSVLTAKLRMGGSIHDELAELDEGVRFFIQQGREAALAELDAAAEKFADDGEGGLDFGVTFGWDAEGECIDSTLIESHESRRQVTARTLTAALLNDGEATDAN